MSFWRVISEAQSSRTEFLRTTCRCIAPGEERGLIWAVGREKTARLVDRFAVFLLDHYRSNLYNFIS